MSTTTRRWVTIVALALVPLLAIAALIGLAGGKDSSASAAVVNLDQAVTVNGQYVPMGRQLAAAMVDRDGDNIDWTLADAPSAAAGLKSGRFSAVVTIPKGFSAAATSFSANDADKAEQATIKVEVGENAPATDSAIAQEISKLAVDTINSTLTNSYLDGIYVGFNSVGEQFTTIVDGAKQLNDGAAKLADGASSAAQGATQLSSGMTQLKDAGPALTSGGGQLVSGVSDLESGTGQLVQGANQLADGVEQFADQTPQLVSGVGELATGADKLLSQVPEFANGAAKAIGGVTPIREGLDQVIEGLGSSSGGDASGLEQLSEGAQGLSDGIDGVSATLGAYSKGNFDSVAQGTIASVKSQFACPDGTPEAACEAMKGAFESGVTAGYQAGAGTGAAMLTTKGANGSSISSGAADLATGVSTAVDTIASETAKQMGELKDGLVKIRDGAAAIETKAAPLVTNAPALANGATSLNSGIQTLNTQVAALPAGVKQLASGSRQLADGVSQLDAGVGTLREGAATYVAGVGTYVDGVSAAADGTGELTDGLVQLSSGAGQLADGTATFASELAKGADQVPSYSANDRQQLAKVAASPVERSDALISSGQVPLVSLLLVTGLWLGALAAFTVYRPVPRDVVASRESSLKLWWASVWLPGAIVSAQGLVLGLIGGVTLDLGVGKTLSLMGLLVFLGIIFVLANHALSAWWGDVGRAVSLLLLVVTIGLGISSSLSWLGPIGAVSPLQNALTLIRTWLADGSGEVGIAAVSVTMAGIAAVMSYLAIASRRRITAEQFRKRLSPAS